MGVLPPSSNDAEGTRRGSEDRAAEYSSVVVAGRLCEPRVRDECVYSGGSLVEGGVARWDLLDDAIPRLDQSPKWVSQSSQAQYGPA